MIEREKLIGLLKRFEPCGYENCENCHDDCYVAQRADFLIKNNIVVLPCKVGDIIYCIDQDADNNGEFYLGIFEGKIKTIALEDDGLWIYCSYNDGLNMWHKIADDLNRIVFLNREEAEKALRNDSNEYQKH